MPLTQQNLKTLENFIKEVEGKNRWNIFFKNTETMDLLEYIHALRLYYWHLRVSDKNIDKMLCSLE